MLRNSQPKREIPSDFTRSSVRSEFWKDERTVFFRRIASKARSQLTFLAQLLLGLFEDAIVNDPVQSELFIDNAATNIFVEHDLNAIRGHGEVHRIAGNKEIVGAIDDIRFSFKACGVAGLYRLLFVVLDELHSRDDCLEESLGGFRVFFQNITSGHEHALGNFQGFIEIDDHRKAFVEEPYGIFGGERRGGDKAFFQCDGTQRGAADGAENYVFVRIEVVSLQIDPDGKIGEGTSAGYAYDLAAQFFHRPGLFAAESRVIGIVGLGS